MRTGENEVRMMDYVRAEVRSLYFLRDFSLAFTTAHEGSGAPLPVVLGCG
jgi:hypothetical protein